MALTPSELIQLRSRLISSNRIEDLQLWVILLVSLKLFLQPGEATGDTIISGIVTPTGIQSDNYDPSLTAIRHGEPIFIGFNIQDTTIQKSRTMTMWFDKKVKEFCPVSHLLGYVYLLNYKGGHLFPTLQELQDPPQDGVYKTWLDEQTFHSRFIRHCQDLFPTRNECDSDTIAKTAYVLAKWSGADFDDIQYDARLSTRTAKKYERETRHLLQDYFTIGGAKSEMKGILCESTSIYRSLNEPNSTKKGLYDVSKDFLVDICKVEADSINFGPLYVVEKVTNYRKSEELDATISMQECGRYLPRNTVSQMRNMIVTLVENGLKEYESNRNYDYLRSQASTSSLAITQVDAPNNAREREPETATVPPKERKRKAAGDIELNRKADVKTLRGIKE